MMEIDLSLKFVWRLTLFLCFWNDFNHLNNVFALSVSPVDSTAWFGHELNFFFLQVKFEILRFSTLPLCKCCDVSSKTYFSIDSRSYSWWMRAYQQLKFADFRPKNQASLPGDDRCYTFVYDLCYECSSLGLKNIIKRGALFIQSPVTPSIPAYFCSSIDLIGNYMHSCIAYKQFISKRTSILCALFSFHSIWKFEQSNRRRLCSSLHCGFFFFASSSFF